LARVAKVDVLVLDDFLLAPMGDAERRDLLEILEDRLVHNAHVLALRGPSIRRKKGLGSTQPETTT
jgi:DNA replication protein DnaC